jgi:hypothetical protein
LGLTHPSRRASAVLSFQRLLATLRRSVAAATLLRSVVNQRRKESKKTAKGISTMKALSIRQPFATLILLGVKQYEIRNWGTQYRGPLLIHASKTPDFQAADLCLMEPFRSLLREAGYYSSVDLPRGVLLGTVELLDCLPLRQVQLSGARDGLLYDGRRGRYALQLGDPRPFPMPRTAVGRLGLYEVGLSA